MKYDGNCLCFAIGSHIYILLQSALQPLVVFGLLHISMYYFKIFCVNSVSFPEHDNQNTPSFQNIIFGEGSLMDSSKIISFIVYHCHNIDEFG